MRIVAERDWWPDDPALLPDLLDDERIGIVSLRVEITAEGGLRIEPQEREVDAAVILDQQRSIVGDDLSEQRSEKQHEENPGRPITALVGLEILNPPARHRLDPNAQNAILSRHVDGGGGHVSRPSKSIRGSTII